MMAEAAPITPKEEKEKLHENLLQRFQNFRERWKLFQSVKKIVGKFAILIQLTEEWGVNR